jgi:sugar O-acyltransferase (sialic acid O-acetyltransferase NeuD family)
MKKNLPRIAILGASGHGLVTLEAALAQGYEVAGFLDSFKPVGLEVLGHRVIGHPDQLPALMREHHFSGGILAVSNNLTRSIVAEKVRQLAPDFKFATVVHPRAWVSPSATLGPGTLVLTGAIIHACCQVGEQVIVNTKVSLDHESKLGAFASLLPGVTTGGDVQVGDYSCVCAGSTLSHQIVIGRHTVVGAGSLVLRNLPDEVIAFGVPARVIRSRRPDERHF